MKSRRGQTILEYTIVVVIMLGVILAMKDYVKRGIQGRWKSATDDLGQQYDPQAINSSINYSTVDNEDSIVNVQKESSAVVGQTTEPGYWTSRTDTSNSVENKTGFTQVGN